MTRIVRKDYDKPNRCPAWSGPGMNFTYPWEKSLPGCRNGSSGYYLDGAERGYARAGWRVHRCRECGTRTWPYALRWLDPFYVIGKLTRWRVRWA